MLVGLITATGILLASPSQSLSAPGFTVVGDAGEVAVSFAGIYNLRGQMETASGLRINEDGRFDWYLVVGGLDLFAKGSWSDEGETINLVFEKFEGNDPELTDNGGKPINTLILRKDGENLVPTDQVGGIYVRTQPRKVDE